MTEWIVCFEDGRIVVSADTPLILPSGALQFVTLGPNSLEVTVMAIAPGKWLSFFPSASEDGIKWTSHGVPKVA